MGRGWVAVGTGVIYRARSPHIKESCVCGGFFAITAEEERGENVVKSKSDDDSGVSKRLCKF